MKKSSLPQVILTLFFHMLFSPNLNKQLTNTKVVRTGVLRRAAEWVLDRGLPPPSTNT